MFPLAKLISLTRLRQYKREKICIWIHKKREISQQKKKKMEFNAVNLSANRSRTQNQIHTSIVGTAHELKVQYEYM